MPLKNLWGTCAGLKAGHLVQGWQAHRVVARFHLTAALGSGMGTSNKRQMSKVGALLLGGLASLLLVNAAWRLFEGDARNVVFSWVVIALCVVSYGYAFWAYRRAVKNPPTPDSSAR